MVLKRKYIVAVSGGVDSVVLLDMLARQGDTELFVAHFDHGIREDSAADARFVEGLAKKYALPFFSVREELGPKASEELARSRRYLFLRGLARKYDATIVTAHHADDIIETMAINIIRGTGWRGIAVLGAPDIKRPLVSLSKADIYTYALEHRLEWAEDSTNMTERYLRNRVRRQIFRILTAEKREMLLGLWREQTAHKQAIDSEARQILTERKSHSRYFFICIDKETGEELLRMVIHADTGKNLLMAQVARGLLAIKTALPGTVIQLGAGVMLRFSGDSFVALQSEKML